MIDFSQIIIILSLPAVQWSIVVLLALGVVAWFELALLCHLFTSRGWVSKIVHIGSTHHDRAVPSGGGIGVIDMMAISLILWLIFIATDVALPNILGWKFFFAICIICLLSFADDFKPLSPLLRLVVQMVIVFVMLPALPGPVLLGYVPLWLDNLFAFLFWVTFMNFFNFMDGIDGISGVEMGSVGAGLALVTLAIGSQDIFLTTGLAGFALMIIAIIFLMWNWSPAKIFLGDSGSIPIGFIIAGLMLQLSSYGYWEAAVILPLYYYLDAGLTLLKRIIRGEKIWLPHVSNFFHIARISGYPHHVISRTILINNILLIIFALLSLKYEILSLSAAFVTTSLLLCWMKFTKPS